MPPTSYLDLPASKESFSLSAEVLEVIAKSFKESQVETLPLRVVSQIGEYPSFLHNSLHPETTWNSKTDVLVQSRPIAVIMDRLSAIRLRNGRVDWNDDDGRIRFSAPDWPRLSGEQEPWQKDTSREDEPIIYELLENEQFGTVPGQDPKDVSAANRTAVAEPTAQLKRSPDSSQSSSVVRSGLGVLAVAVLAVGGMALKKVPSAAMRGIDQPANAATNPGAVGTAPKDWNAAIKAGEDVPEPILMLAGIELEHYRKYQEAKRQEAEAQDDVSEATSTEESEDNIAPSTAAVESEVEDSDPAAKTPL